MVYGSDWTGERVRERLIAAFKQLCAGCFSPRESVFEQATGPIDGMLLVGACQAILGRRSEECVQLLTYCRVMALNDRDAGWSSTCRAHGWVVKTANRHVRAASDQVAKRLNERSAAPQLRACA